MDTLTLKYRHGGPRDRGAADAYYRRPYAPHYYVGDTYSSPRIGEDDMTPNEIGEYICGWEEQTRSGVFK